MAKKSQPEIIPPEASGNTELALFPKLNLPSVTGITEEMNKSFGTMYTRIEAGIAELPTDMTIKANREKVASYAYSISRTKTGLDAAAKDVAGDAKLIVDAVNTERSQLKTTLDKLRDKAREKLDAWEEAEKKREQNVRDAIGSFQNVAIDHAGADSEGLSMVLDNLKAWQFKQERYGEQVEDVQAAHKIAVERITEMMEAAAKREAEARELEQLRREKAEREAAAAAQKAKEEQEAAAAAEVARQAAERDRLAREAEEKAKRDAAEAIEKAKQEQAAAEQRAIDAENQRIKDAEATKKAIAEQQEASRRWQAEQEEQRKEAAARAEEQARLREEQAREAERQRIAREQAAKDQADRERAADIAHRKKLNGEAVAALMKTAGLSEKDAQAVVIAIYKEQVPHVAINY